MSIFFTNIFPETLFLYYDEKNLINNNKFTQCEVIIVTIYLQSDYLIYRSLKDESSLKNLYTLIENLPDNDLNILKSIHQLVPNKSHEFNVPKKKTGVPFGCFILAKFWDGSIKMIEISKSNSNYKNFLLSTKDGIKFIDKIKE